MKLKKPVKLIFIMIISGSIGLTFGFGVAQGVMANNKLVNAIETKLQKNCNCEIVSSDVSSVGIQFNVEDGFSNSKASFILENCAFPLSVEHEAIRLNDMLKRDIENYDSLDLITFHFKNSDQQKPVKFKEGCLLETGNI
ncbi:hypothetical protein C8P64_1121 [Christiangramia gaetbulicola]|uniref:Uncharacterized protein n=1 Tax=Christiangramia gaetbulicola TaxID=703340 RepID=A0A2T6AMT4_9FLAO|nr:hypothetical protein [Christiangramia gaetbulicola]PTX45131.1 hypothetical protein C8P64_1121 [Christiangramia gaetbulicola]